MNVHLIFVCSFAIVCFPISSTSPNTCTGYQAFHVKTDPMNRGLCALDSNPLSVIQKTDHIVYCLRACLDHPRCYAYTYQLETSECRISFWPLLYDYIPNCLSYTDQSLKCPALDPQLKRTPSVCCHIPFTFQNQLYYECIDGGEGFLGCYYKNHTWVACDPPRDYVALIETINLKIPNTTVTTPVLFVNTWIIFQQRFINGMDYEGQLLTMFSFELPWSAYRNGFGDLTQGPGHGFWLGLERIRQLTANNRYMMRIEVKWWGSNVWMSGEYDAFEVGGESDQYRIKVAGWNGDHAEPMGKQNGGQFHTYDRGSRSSLAANQNGGFWFHPTDSNVDTNLNGNDLMSTYVSTGWWSGYTYQYSRITPYCGYVLDTTRMMMKRVD